MMTLKYEKAIPSGCISQVMEVMRWKKGENIEGEYPVKDNDVVRIEEILGENFRLIGVFYWGLRLAKEL